MVVHGEQRFEYARPLQRRRRGHRAVHDLRHPGRRAADDAQHQDRDPARSTASTCAPRTRRWSNAAVARDRASRAAWQLRRRRGGHRARRGQLPGHPAQPGQVLRRVRRLQRDPLERADRPVGRAARRHRARHVHDGAGRAVRHRLGRRPGPWSWTSASGSPRRWSCPTTTPGATIEVSGTVEEKLDDNRVALALTARSATPRCSPGPAPWSSCCPDRGPAALTGLASPAARPAGDSPPRGPGAAVLAARSLSRVAARAGLLSSRPWVSFVTLARRRQSWIARSSTFCRNPRCPGSGTTSSPTCPRRRRRRCTRAPASRSAPTTWRRCSRWR